MTMNISWDRLFRLCRQKNSSLFEFLKNSFLFVSPFRLFSPPNFFPIYPSLLMAEWKTSLERIIQEHDLEYVLLFLSSSFFAVSFLSLIYIRNIENLFCPFASYQTHVIDPSLFGGLETYSNNVWDGLKVILQLNHSNPKSIPSSAIYWRLSLNHLYQNRKRRW
jgi:hypothetical protein